MKHKPCPAIKHAVNQKETLEMCVILQNVVGIYLSEQRILPELKKKSMSCFMGSYY